MKKSIYIFCLSLLVSMTFAQEYSISGSIINQEDPLIGAHVNLYNSTSAKNISTTSNADGYFEFTSLDSDNFVLSISYIGYSDTSISIQVIDRSVLLGTIELEAGVHLSALEIIEEVVPVIQKGDTTQYNASAYKSLPDASAEDLLLKMPTMYLENGKMQAQGEDVEKVLVDGKPFFGNNPTAALRSLPAEVIDKIEVFDEQSDQAKFTGFDDGETTKTLNIITKEDNRNGQFGKVYSGYGNSNKYTLGGNVNIFNGDQRLSIIGMSNNINQQNFSSADLLGVTGSGGRRGGGPGGVRPGGGGGPGGGRGPRSRGGDNSSDFLVSSQGGINTSHSFGVNFTDTWGKNTDLGISYFFNNSDNISDQIIDQDYFTTDNFFDTYREQNESYSTNTNHRITGKLDYTINENNSLIWRPRLTWQKNDGSENTFGQNFLTSDLISSSENTFSSDLTALNFNNDLLWRHNFEKARRTFSVNISSGFQPQSGDKILSSSTYQMLDTTNASNINQFASLNQSNWNTSVRLQFTEPIGQNGMIMTQYRTSYKKDENNIETFDFNEWTDEYDLWNNELSNYFSNDYLSHEIGAGYNYRSGNFSIMARAGAEYSKLINEEIAPNEYLISTSYFNVLPMAMIRYNLSRSKNLRIFYRTNTSLPSISQLQNVPDISNPLQVTIGNPDLAQSYNHTINARFSSTNTEKSSVLFALFSGSFTKDYIGTNTYLSAEQSPYYNLYDIDQNAQISTSENLDGYYNIRSMLTYGFPITPIQSNLNIDVLGSYSHTPGMLADAINYTGNTSMGLGLTLSSNISETIDFTISSRSSYNTSKYSLEQYSNQNYFNQNSKAKLDWVLGNGITFRTEVTHQLYNGLSSDLDQNFILWNLSLGKKVFANQRGEISLSVFDALKQNTSLARTVSELYTQDVQSTVLQQYFMLNFKYNLRNFKVKNM